MPVKERIWNAELELVIDALDDFRPGACSPYKREGTILLAAKLINILQNRAELEIVEIATNSQTAC